MRQISKNWGSKILKRGRPLYMVLYHMLMAIYMYPAFVRNLRCIQQFI